MSKHVLNTRLIVAIHIIGTRIAKQDLARRAALRRSGLLEQSRPNRALGG